jgi:hypothetical protein
MLEISSAGDDTNVIVMSQGGNYKNSIQNSHSGSASNARMSFFVHDSSTTQANVMSLLGNGNVGIGCRCRRQSGRVYGSVGIPTDDLSNFTPYADITEAEGTSVDARMLLVMKK